MKSNNEDRVKEVLNNGYTVFENAITNDQFKELEYIANLYIKRSYKRNEGSGNLIYNLFKTADLLPDFLMPDLINVDEVYKIIKELLGENFNLTEILAFYSHPNNDKQELHTDVLPYFSEKEIELPPSVIAVQFPLIEFNEISGGTRIVPNTQNSFQKIPSVEEENKEGYNVITPKVETLSCLIRDCRAWHGAGINNTDQIRSMITLVYKRNWCSPKSKVSKDLYFSIDKSKRHLVTV